jgi:hypothetical protein
MRAMYGQDYAPGGTILEVKFEPAEKKAPTDSESQ